tara:strand:- start:2545 stop:3786 length:1242 start_codon:yes stop_codon:yes gene_type:complete
MDLANVKYWKHPSKTNCVFVEQSDSPLISLHFWFKAGISFEEKNKVGLAHFLEHMIFKGSKLLEPGEFDLKIETLGGFSNAATGYDDVHYYVDIPPSNLEEALSLLTNLVLYPNLNEKEFDLEKKVISEEILQSQDQKDELIFNFFLKSIWLDHPYAKSILGKEENINEIELIDLHNFHEKHYIPINSCIAVAGKLPKNYLEIFKNCELRGSRKNLVDAKQIFLDHKSIKKGREIAYFKDIEFSRIFLAWKIPCSKDQKNILGYEIISSILTDGRNSILYRSLKEDKQIVESIYSGIQLGEFGSLFIIEASLKKENLKNVENIINNLLKKLFTDSKLNNKVQKALRIVKSNYIFNLETSSQLSYFYGNHLLWGRLNPHKEFSKNFKYWENTENLKELIELLLQDKFIFIAHNK